ncbi:MAG TPA: HAD family hydrolase [Pseudoneobacillus sp.]|nr:HAD family hydrolase [Pseudoneobacillus sp.]
MSIKAIFLDFYGTVVHEEEESLIKICHIIKEKSNTEATVADIGHYWMKDFNQLLTNSQGENFLKQRDVSTTSLRNTLTEFNSTANENELLELMFHQWKNPSIYEDAVEFFEKNKLPVYILSNVDHSDITDAINQLQLKVDGVITSETVKAYKPSREMFEHALTLTNFSPDEVLHVGDSLPGDVSGANQVGIKSAWLNRKGKPLSGDSKPTYVIENLNEILNLIQ